MVPAAERGIVRMRFIVLALVAVVLAGAATGAARRPATLGCSVFPATNAWNQRVDRLPVAADSNAIVASIGATGHLHADFGSGLWNGSPIGIPVTVVGSSTPRSNVSFEYDDESDPGPYPIPANVQIEGGSDAHAILVDRDACKLYELFALTGSSGSGWHAGSGAIWPLTTNRLRPAGWTSADAAGLPILPGPRAVRRGRARTHPARAPLHRLADVDAPTSGRHATSRALSPIRRCRRWASGSG